ncbi:MAG TPA: DUF2867 domain-containing protein, partial [Candidatus Latescibacteria bacterium]|nr:DUF2867 domain-containing protein [Candidatus Latescibacterota bacterium]
MKSLSLGEKLWHFATWVWRLRGFVDLLMGGMGMRRGRRHPTDLRPGDILDFWRVETCQDQHLLRLQAEIKVQYLLLIAGGFILMLWMSWGVYVIHSTERPPTRCYNPSRPMWNCVNTRRRHGSPPRRKPTMP